MPRRGQDPGHAAAAATPGAALDWAAYLDGLVAEHGTLAAVAERLAAARAHRDDVESIARALRRLRARGSRAGGTWGERLIATCGLPQPVEARLRFMGSYHARFVDLPLPLCADLVALWDRPPTSDSRGGRAWLSLARAILAMRAQRPADAAVHLATAARVADADPRARIEVALGQANLDSRAAPGVVPAALAPVERWLADLAGDDAACLRARWVGQVAHAWNHAGKLDDALALHAALPDDATTPAFARSRRANGLAYGLHRLGRRTDALAEARRAATFAGDAGHVRLRAMALLMIARIAGATAEGRDAHARAAAIADALADATLAHRCAVAARDVS